MLPEAAIFLSGKNRFESLKQATELSRSRRRQKSSTPNPDLPLLRRRRRPGRVREATFDLWAMGLLIAELIGGIILQL